MRLLTIPTNALALTVEHNHDGTTSLYDRTEDQIDNESVNEVGTHLWTGPTHMATEALNGLGFKDLHDMSFLSGHTVDHARAFYRGHLLDAVRETLLAEAA